MKISSLILKLQKIQSKHGNLHVKKTDSKTWPDCEQPDLEQVEVEEFAGKYYLFLR